MTRWLLVLVLLVLGMAQAQAASYEDQGLAYAGCQADVVGKTSGTSVGACREDLPGRAYVTTWKKADGTWGNTIGTGAGDSRHTWPAGKTCAARPATTSGWSSLGNGSSCSAGCAVGPAASSERMTVAGKTYFSLAGATPTGAVCTYGADEGKGVAQDECVQVGNLTQCVTSAGKHCAVASTGKKFCWTPGETGTKVSGNEAATKSPSSATVNPPPVPPKNNGEWQQTGSGTVAVTSGGSTKDYNVTNYTSDYGTQGIGGGAEGEGDGSGSGDGGDGYGEPGEGVGTLYEGTDKTVESVMGNFYTAVTNTQFVSGVTAFMTVQGGGSCPTFSLTATQWWEAQVFDAHCSGAILALLQAMGWVVFALACYLAVKIAVT